MRVEAAAKARLERAAPCVMLPASTMCRNRFKSVKSNRIRGYLLISRRQTTQKAYCNAEFSGPSFANHEVTGSGQGSSGIIGPPYFRPGPQCRLARRAARWSLEADDGRT